LYSSIFGFVNIAERLNGPGLTPCGFQKVIGSDADSGYLPNN